MKSVYFKKNHKENQLKKHVQPRYETARVLEIMKSVYLQRNYKGNLLETHPQPRYETAPGLRNHEIRIFFKELQKKSLERYMLCMYIHNVPYQFIDYVGLRIQPTLS